MFARLMNSNPDPAQLATVRLWLSASDHLPDDVRERLRGYGALAAFAGRTAHSAGASEWLRHGGAGRTGHDGRRVSFSPGSGQLCFPIPPFRIRVADETAAALARARRESARFSAAASSALLEGQGKSEGLLTSDGWLRTGDLATRNHLGLIRLVGRMKDVIKSGGYSVYVRELEEAILTHPAVSRAVAFGLPHREKGEFPAAAVELSPASTPVKAISWSGAGNFLRPTKRRAASGFWIRAACRRIPTARSCAGFCASDTLKVRRIAPHSCEAKS